MQWRVRERLEGIMKNGWLHFFEGLRGGMGRWGGGVDGSEAEAEVAGGSEGGLSVVEGPSGGEFFSLETVSVRERSSSSRDSLKAVVSMPSRRGSVP